MPYLIMIREGLEFKYLFNTRMLVHDPALARPFSTQTLAKRYLKKSAFATRTYKLTQISQESSSRQCLTDL